MTSDSDEPKTSCPVCQEHTVGDNLQSQGIVISGLKALLDGDATTIKNVFATLTPYDGHTAIGLCAALLNDLSYVTGIPIDGWLEKYREALNAAQAEH